ncbi:hypothetical protein AVEN_32934-1 [Araneus ventricosus]|uniref:Uncharacterized protein n=1 Tax=Araneus ventricosus TaxID=182803 RepID=A0A4Y2L7J1_ARAVE|nr:hypothetical protein AVEN_32934-1 [Araneus ventricosus]
MTPWHLLKLAPKASPLAPKSLPNWEGTRNRCISKRGLAPLVGILMVMWLLGLISKDGPYPPKGRGVHEPLVKKATGSILLQRSRMILVLRQAGGDSKFVCPFCLSPTREHHEYVDEKPQDK